MGFREVEARRKRWKSQTTKAGRGLLLLQKHQIPVITGPEAAKHYILDHHHLALALHQEGLQEMYVTVVADLSALKQDAFWFVMDNRDWIHPFDRKGVRNHTAIPRRIEKLQDDPFRSLAGEVRRGGGFAKDTTLYSEFLWADFLRRRLKPRAVSADFKRALRQALKLAKSKEASYLPGWCGKVEE